MITEMCHGKRPVNDLAEQAVLLFADPEPQVERPGACLEQGEAECELLRAWLGALEEELCTVREDAGDQVRQRDQAIADLLAERAQKDTQIAALAARIEDLDRQRRAAVEAAKRCVEKFETELRALTSLLDETATWARESLESMRDQLRSARDHGARLAARLASTQQEVEAREHSLAAAVEQRDALRMQLRQVEEALDTPPGCGATHWREPAGTDPASVRPPCTVLLKLTRIGSTEIVREWSWPAEDARADDVAPASSVAEKSMRSPANVLLAAGSRESGARMTLGAAG
jgi:hypothetical protein